MNRQKKSQHKVKLNTWFGITDLENIKTLFHQSSLYVFAHHLQLHQEHPFPPRLQEVTWWIRGVVTSFQMLNLDETFSKAFLGYFDYFDTVSTSIRIIPVLQDPTRRGLEGLVES